MLLESLVDISVFLFCFLFLTWPFFADLRGVDEMIFDFKLGTPFKPYEQLMGVLPVASMEHIPMAYRVSGYSFSIYYLYSFSLDDRI